MPGAGFVDLSIDEPIWERFFTVAPLVVIGTVEKDGTPDLAPKHLAGPMAWSNLFGFVCAPTHATYRNLCRAGEFTVSYPRPDQVLAISLAAAPRDVDNTKPALRALDTIAAETVEGVLLDGAAVHLECRLERLVADLDANALVIGRVVAARVAETALRALDRDDADLLAEVPQLVFVAPDHFAEVRSAQSFPFHAGWQR